MAVWLMRKGSDGRYVREACERSLESLDLEWTDLFYVHRFAWVTPVDDRVEVVCLSFPSFISCIRNDFFFFSVLSSFLFPSFLFLDSFHFDLVPPEVSTSA